MGKDTNDEPDLRFIGPGADLCWFHGEEPIPEDVFRICGECGHAWRREELEAAHREHFPQAHTIAEDIWTCPLCIHDF